MSGLKLRTQGHGTFDMYVISFSGGLYGSVSSLQTKTIQQHFPVRANQPELQFTVVFKNEDEYEKFQKFIQKQHKDCLKATPTSNVGVQIWWPEREMDNWSGIITEFEGGGRKQNWAPRSKFTVQLVDSWVSRKTSISSYGADFSSVYEDSPLTKLLATLGGAFEDQFLRLPSRAVSAYGFNNTASEPSVSTATKGFQGASATGTGSGSTS